MAAFIKIPGVQGEGRRPAAADHPSAFARAQVSGIFQNPPVPFRVADEEAVQPAAGGQGRHPDEDLAHSGSWDGLWIRQMGVGSQRNRCRRPPPQPGPQQGRPNRLAGQQQTRCHCAGQTGRAPSHPRRFQTGEAEMSGDDTEEQKHDGGAHGRESRPSRRRGGNVRVGSSQTGSGSLHAFFESAVSRTGWGRVQRTTACLERNSPRQCCPGIDRWCSGLPRASTTPFRGLALPP